MNKLLNYFEKNTQKYKLLRWIDGYLQYKPMIKDNHALSVKKILLLLNKIESCDVSFMERYFKRRHITIRTYLNILKKQRKIRISNKPVTWSNSISDTTTINLKKTVHDELFAKIKEKLGHYKNAASVLGVHKATLSAWKLQKSRIPVEILRQMCLMCEIDFEDITPSIIQTDRDIIELTQLPEGSRKTIYLQ